MSLMDTRLRRPTYLPNAAAGAMPSATAVDTAGGIIPGNVIGMPVREFTGAASDAFNGRVSLILLDTIVIAMIAFYIWTRGAQGGG